MKGPCWKTLQAGPSWSSQRVLREGPAWVFKDFNSNFTCIVWQLLWREFFYTVGYGTPNYDRMYGNPICKQVCYSPFCFHVDLFGRNWVEIYAYVLKTSSTRSYVLLSVLFDSVRRKHYENLFHLIICDHSFFLKKLPMLGILSAYMHVFLIVLIVVIMIRYHGKMMISC